MPDTTLALPPLAPGQETEALYLQHFREEQLTYHGVRYTSRPCPHRWIPRGGWKKIRVRLAGGWIYLSPAC